MSVKVDSSKFVVADPSLRDARGHHYPLTLRISDSARNAGFYPIWFSHLDAAFDEAPAAEIQRTFSITLYDAYRPSTPLMVPASILTRVLGRFSGVRKHSNKTAQEPHEVLATQLQRSVTYTSLGPHDRILFHTADGMTYGAIDHYLSLVKPASAPKIHICTPYDPSGVMPNRIATRPIDLIVKSWQESGLIGDRIFLHAENEQLAQHLSSLWHQPVNPLPLPTVSVPQGDTSGHLVDWPVKEADALRVVHLGPARIEKGFDLLPDIIAHALKAFGWTGRDDTPPPVCFVIHCTPQIVGYAPRVLDAIERLKEFPTSVVRLITDKMSELEYFDWAKTSDVFLLPYGKREYANWSSGIVSEALSMGKIIVATADTYPASMIRPNTGLSATDAMGFGRALAEVGNNIDQYRKAALEWGTQYRIEYSAETYVPRCLAWEGSALARSKSLVSPLPCYFG